jgi:hypothetical protein
MNAHPSPPTLGPDQTRNLTGCSHSPAQEATIASRPFGSDGVCRQTFVRDSFPQSCRAIQGHQAGLFQAQMGSVAGWPSALPHYCLFLPHAQHIGNTITSPALIPTTGSHPST